MDPLVREQYEDKAVHDGGWRAGDVFTHTTNGFDESSRASATDRPPRVSGRSARS
jgi:hypothetical protein